MKAVRVNDQITEVRQKYQANYVNLPAQPEFKKKNSIVLNVPGTLTQGQFKINEAIVPAPRDCLYQSLCESSKVISAL